MGLVIGNEAGAWMRLAWEARGDGGGLGACARCLSGGWIAVWFGGKINVAEDDERGPERAKRIYKSERRAVTAQEQLSHPDRKQTGNNNRRQTAHLWLGP